MSGAYTTVTTVSGSVTIIATETYTNLPTSLVDTIDDLGINPNVVFPLILTALVGALILVYIFAFVGYILWDRRKQNQNKVPAPKSPNTNDIPLQDLASRNKEDATKEKKNYKTYLHDFVDLSERKKSKKGTVRQRPKSVASPTSSLPITPSRSEFGSASAVDVELYN